VRVAKKIELETVKITYPVWYGDRQYLPGETATVTVAKATEWKSNMQAVSVAAEVKEDG
jgi:hypothetical protein